ncbi:MAG: NAD-dependent epimerase/dehydratase family protein [Micrococcales bacterium]|nr:NAD-dependent epimerase/dehydratase family protein [Micrococcales bacterium]
MRLAVIGATGHVGGYLVPRLVRAGHEVVALSRGEQRPYHDDSAWSEVGRRRIDRATAEAEGTFASQIADLDADAVIDMICFTPASAASLVEALRGRTGHLVVCSSIWAAGWLREVPGREDDASEPWGEYGIGKRRVEELLAAESARDGGLRTTALRPGHISGPGWPVITPQGNLDGTVWERLASGGDVLRPGFGLETLNHVHADDVAQAFELALRPEYRGSGERFTVVAERAATARGLAQQAAEGFGRDAVLRFASWDEFAASLDPADAEASREHLSRSQAMSSERARAALGYAPRYRPIDAVAEAVNRLAELGRLDLGGHRLDAERVA